MNKDSADHGGCVCCRTADYPAGWSRLCDLNTKALISGHYLRNLHCTLLASGKGREAVWFCVQHRSRMEVSLWHIV